tara:strand:+ start:234 stop:416 length:183 start_codon:yes stop_codon:yes gene_type:complete
MMKYLVQVMVTREIDADTESEALIAVGVNDDDLMYIAPHDSIEVRQWENRGRKGWMGEAN